MIYISSNNVRHPVTKTFTPLHYAEPNYTSLLFTTLVDTSRTLVDTSCTLVDTSRTLVDTSRTLVDTSLIEGVKVKCS